MGRTPALNENRTTRQRQSRYQHVVGSEDVLAGSPQHQQQSNDNEEVTEIPEQPLPYNNDTTPLEHDAVQNVSAPSDQADNDDDVISDSPSNEELFISIDDAIERLGMGNFQFIILIASGLCFAADAMQVILLSFLTLVLQQEWQLTNEETAFISSILFVGALVGTLILGPLADSKGRRPIFLLAASIIFVFAELVALCQTYEALLACMFFVGCGVGGLTVPFDLLAEFLPAAGRGTRLLLIEYFWTGGCLYVVAVAYFTLHQGYWRIFVALCAIPCLIAVMVGLCFVPESARWLVAQGRSEQAMDVLRKAAKMNGLDVELVFPPELSLRQETEEKEANCTELFRPRWFEITLRLWGAWCAFAFGYYGTIMATTRVFESTAAVANSTSGNDTPDNQPNETAFFLEETAFMDNSRTLQQETKDRIPEFDYGAIFLSSAAELVGTTIVILAVDRAGRIPSQVLSYTFAGISVIALCFLAEAGAQRLTLIALGFCARVFEMAGTCVSWVSTAEIFTTEVRGIGHSTANAAARLGAFFAPFVVDDLSLRSIGVIMLVVHIFTVTCVAKLPETAGRALGAVDAHDDDIFHRQNDDQGALNTGSSAIIQNGSQDDSMDEPDALIRAENGPIATNEDGVMT